MTNRQLLEAIEEVVDVEPGTLCGDEKLDELANWDSLAFLTFMAMADSRFGLKLAPETVRACASVADLCGILAYAGMGMGESPGTAETGVAQA
jgi:acyl carrier protein